MLTKYNDDGEDVLSILTSDGGSKRDGDESRSDYRKKAKANKNNDRSIAAGADHKSFCQRGLSIEARLYVIEMAQVEDSKKNHNSQVSIAHANTQQQMLLDDRKQAIALAQTICPTYSVDSEFWMDVRTLTK